MIYLAIGGLITLLVVFVLCPEKRPDFKVRHTAAPDAEFSETSPVTDFKEYVTQEEKLFQQLDEMAYARVEPKTGTI